MYLAKSVLPYFLIVRPGICIGVFFIVMLSTSLADPSSFPFFAALLGAGGIALVAGSGSVVNDIFDWRADEVNNPQRPLPQRSLSREAAWRYYFLLLAISLFFLWLVKPWVFLIGVGMVSILFLYSWKLREVNGLLSNTVIAITMGLTFSFGAAITGNFTVAIAFLFGFGFSITLAREILGDVTDLKGDIIHGKLKTIPMSLGVKRSLVVVMIILFVTALMSYALLIAWGIFARPLLGLAASTLYVLAVAFVLRRISIGRTREAQNILKGALFLCPLVIVLASTSF